MATRKNASGGNSLMTLGLLAVGGYFVYEWFFATPATAAPATAAPLPAGSPSLPASATAAATAAPVSTPTATAAVPSQLDTIYSNLKAAAQPDQQFTGSGDALSGLPYHWIYYLQTVYSGNIPDVGSLMDVNTPIAAAAFWAIMGPALKAANSGLSGGLGCFAGAGAFMRGMGAYSWR